MFPDLEHYPIKSKLLTDEVRQIVDMYESINYALSLNNGEPTKLQKPLQWSKEIAPMVIKK